MSEIKIDDLSSAIETLAKSLGMAAEEIIPYYVKLEVIRGILWTFGGLLLVVLPFILFYPIPPPNWAECREVNLLIGGAYALKWAICIGSPWGGAYTMFENIDKLIAPKALAISKLINQVT